MVIGVISLSNVANTIKDDISGALGNVSKATLIFVGETIEEVVKDEQEKNKLNSLFASNTNLSDVRNKLSELSMTSNKFSVQFNPSALRLDARGGGFQKVVNFSPKKEGVEGDFEFKSLDPYINIYFDIIVDNTNNADVFMADKFILGSTTTAKNVATAVANVVTDNEYTVRPQVEGFIAALRSSTHRTVIFQWGSMRYTGALNSVNCRYTLFNTAGNPVRAVISINILVGSTAEINHLGYWQERYKTIIDELTQKKESIDSEGNQKTTISGNANNNVFNNIYNSFK